MIQVKRTRSMLEVKTVDTSNLKTEAHRVIDSLPETATWDDLMYEI
jgi:hypothetical protein